MSNLSTFIRANCFSILIPQQSHISHSKLMRKFCRKICANLFAIIPMIFFLFCKKRGRLHLPLLSNGKLFKEAWLFQRIGDSLEFTPNTGDWSLKKSFAYYFVICARALMRKLLGSFFWCLVMTFWKSRSLIGCEMILWTRFVGLFSMKKMLQYTDQIGQSLQTKMPVF